MDVIYKKLKQLDLEREIIHDLIHLQYSTMPLEIRRHQLEGETDDPKIIALQGLYNEKIIISLELADDLIILSKI